MTRYPSRLERTGVSIMEGQCVTAAHELSRQDSASMRWPTFGQLLVGTALIALIAIGLIFAPDRVGNIVLLIAAATFLVSSIWRLALIIISMSSPPVADAPDIWPRYSILAALHDEEKVVPQLIERLGKIDYPADRLQGFLVLEAHDHATIQAALGTPRPDWLDIFIAPAGTPRTKPRALNCALPHVNGEILTVYDAEDDPDPQQLKEAASRFASDASGRLACLQAPLRIRRKHASAKPSHFLDRQFAAEYASLFESALPGMAKLGLPFPLGGTSNHFRVDVLRKVGGWDAFNVTEDADLGFRLWRRGWRLGVITRPTWETPPGGLACWLPQRTRWLKGYMQTWGTHTRHLLQLGLRGVFALAITLGAGLASAALYGPSLAWFVMMVSVYSIAGLSPQTPALAICVLCVGTASAWLSCAIGTRRAGIPYRVQDMLTAPFYWSLLSLAFVHAAWRLVREPFAWDKTPHAPDRPLQYQVQGSSAEGRLDAPLPVRLSASDVAAPEPIA